MTKNANNTSKPRPLKSQYSAECQAWRNAIDRCTRPSHPQYKDYGQRGITVAPEFIGPDGFQVFIDTVGPKPSPELTLDRVDNSKGYEPGNLAWTSRTVQQRNRRTRNTVMDYGWGTGTYLSARSDGLVRKMQAPLITLGERTQTLNDWAEELGIGVVTLRRRIQSGKTPEKALTSTLFNPWGNPRQDQTKH